MALSFLDRIRGGRPITSDGAMGTLINQRMNGFHGCFDELNVSKPALIEEIHRQYLDAGAELIKTNTFGANPFKLAENGLENHLCEINAAGYQIAASAISQSGKRAWIAGDVGPLGVRLAPFGRVQQDTAREAFRKQIECLFTAGVDLILIETITDLYEVREAIHAARAAAPGLPVVASMTFTRDDRTILGDPPQKIALELHQAGADLIGINCSGGPNQVLRLLKEMHQAVPDGMFSVMPNAGWPEQIGGRFLYPADADYFGDYAQLYFSNGAKLIGGCCGTTPDHIKAISAAIASAPENRRPAELIITSDDSFPALSTASDTSSLAKALSAGKFAITVEMDPPRGLSTHKVIAGAALLADAGATTINVADSPMARMRMSPWAVCSLIQRQVGIETVLHFPTRGRNLLRVQGDLLAAHALGIRNVFVVMGDPTSIGDYPNAMDNYDVVPSGLIQLIKKQFNYGLDQAGTPLGSPTGFFVGAALNLNPPDRGTELKSLRRKIRNGADFLLTQPVYDAMRAMETIDWLSEGLGGIKMPPILAGIMPLASSRHARFLNQEVPGIQIPDHLVERMEKAGPQALDEGLRIAVDVTHLLRERVQGVYLMPAFNRYDMVARIIDSIRESFGN